MALDTDKKLYIAVGVLAVLGGALYLQKQNQQKEEATYTLGAANADLPKLSISEEDTKKVDKITISQPPGDAGAGTEIVLEKKGENWEITKPITAKANENNVKSLLDNLKTLGVSERIASGTGQYAQHGVSDDKGVHVVVQKGNDKLLDAYFGESGSRGQMMRLAGTEGVYAAKGYSSYLYARDLKGWRDLSLLSFDDKKVTAVEVKNEHGTFTFTKEAAKADAAKQADAGAASADGTWVAKVKPAKAGGVKPLEKFEANKVNDLLRAYKSLNADNFAQDKTEADVGLNEPLATLTITLDDGAKRVLHFGSNAEGSSRWVKKEGDTQIYSVSSWASEWATSDQKKFQKPDEKKDGASPASPPGMPPGMPGMPPGMGAPDMGDDPHG